MPENISDADLQVGDLVELTHPDHPGFTIRGYTTPDPEGAPRADLRLGLGEFLLRNTSGNRNYFFEGYHVALVKRATPPFYVNHTRTEPVVGDVCRDADNPSNHRTWRLSGDGAGRWFDSEGHFHAPPAPRRLLVDGSTGDVVLP